MGKSMLIVIDERAMAKWLPRHFAARGWQVLGIRGLDALAREGAGAVPPPDVILVDAVLDQGDGFSVAQAAKAAYPSAFLVMTSARTGRAAHLKALASGADAYLSKPFRLADLDALVEQGPGAGRPTATGGAGR